MSKLKVVIFATMITWAGFESSQSVTATQLSAPSITPTTYSRGGVTDARSHSVSGREYFALAKKCTLKRYRRPH